MEKLNRRSFLQTACAAAVAGGAARAAARKRNIVWILLDDAGTFDIGCYGQREILTPNIDRLAAEGMQFRNAYAGCAVCAPSRSTLMTGLHTGHTPVRGNQGGVPLAASDRTVASVLKKAGYRTGCFGKWGLGDRYTDGVPWKHGFDEFFGYLHQIHAHYYYTDFLWRNTEKVILEGNLNGQKKQYSADVINEESYKFLAKSKDQPFFLYASTTLPHVQLEPPTDDPYSNRDWTPAEKHYAAMITRADTYVGEIMRRLKEYGIDNDTLVFFTSDNGGTDTGPSRKFHSNGPYRGAKEKVDEGMYEGGIRTPMLARWPGKIRPGSKSDLPWSFWDFLPTAAELAGVEVPPNLDGISVLPTLTGQGRQARHQYLYWEYHDWNFNTRAFNLDKFAQAVRMGAWKVVRPNRDTPLELYNLDEDIGEAHNLAKQKPDLVAKGQAYMKEAHVDMRPQIEPPHQPGQLYDI